MGTSEASRVDFDTQADTYDRQWAKLAPLINGMHQLIGVLLWELPSEARVLVVGAGTGAEILYLSEKFPGWRFTALDPSASMLEVLRRRTGEAGVLSRCEVHHGTIDTLPATEPFDAATSLLVSQFILEPSARSTFFRSIGERLRPGAPFTSADLAADTKSETFQRLLGAWIRIMAPDAHPEMRERMRSNYGQDIALVPADRVAAIIASAGFEEPVQFFQAALIHAWYARRSANGH